MSELKTNGSDIEHKKKVSKKKLAKFILLIIAALILIGVIAVGALVITNYLDLPEWTEIVQEGKSDIYDRNGEFVKEIYGEENRDIKEYEDFPQHLIDAVISTEDNRFYNHSGVDVIRVFGALAADLRSGSKSQGGSTITMQLARNAILNTQEKKLNRKVKETLLALEIEKKYTKEEILTFYLNEVYLGQNVYGMGAASHYYFNKDVSELTLSESALLVGMLPSPNNYAPTKDMDRATNVRNQVLNNMVATGKIDQATADAAKAEEIVLDVQEISATAGYSWMIDYTVAEATDILMELGYSASSALTGEFQIYSTMDLTTQESLEENYADSSLFPRGVGEDLLQSAAVFLDPNTGEILAMQGGREYETRFGFNRASDMLRQPGSIIKPVAVYGPALESGVSPNYRILDARFTTGSYRPENYDGRYRGEINMTTALKYSVNTTAVRMLQEIGVETGWEFAVKCGLPLVEADKGPALALGGITYGVSPLNMATAYACFANGGFHIEPTSVYRICDKNGVVLYEHEPQRTRVMEESTAYSMNTMLKQVISSGTGTRANIGRPAAGKTGTTQLPEAFGTQRGNKDSWWAGYTPDLVGIVWMGFDKDYSENGTPQYMVNVYGGQYPAIIWRNVARVALEDTPRNDWTRPSGYRESINTNDTGTEEEEEEEEEEEDTPQTQQPTTPPATDPTPPATDPGTSPDVPSEPTPEPEPEPEPQPQPEPQPEPTPDDGNDDTPSD